MELMRWNPTRDMFSLRDRINHMFDDVFYPAAKNDDGLSVWDWNPAVDVIDGEDSLVVKAELPGVDKKDIGIEVKDGVLFLRGERSADNEEKGKNFYRRERSYGRFERSFSLPGPVDADKVKAEYKDGVLKIDIPKPEGHKPKRIPVR